MPPERLGGLAPTPPPDLLRRTRDARVVVDVLVTREGTVAQATLRPTPFSELGEISRAAVRDWTFRPATCDGQPVAYRLPVPIRYRGTETRVLRLGGNLP